ncbi:hypothetical protein AOC36_03935 [Erysipelothrix larvae]|uniref:Proton-coupled thiamine transporter YuaJ n=1 Tax=Erysipelothrix larvae TaxID=1514105 RepID=A0A120JTK3_9FIRM|nr:energy-coupled thiamine transporter ThiT [Erysipelothrix larvae]AMC93152.1 hypothetical protein AOC36_03935 [Erysipelothrix larvae]
MKTKDLVNMSLFVALYVALEYLDSAFSIFKMPQGGSLSFSILAIIFASYFFGIKKAVAVTALAFIVRFMLVPMSVVHPMQFLLDYVLAPGCYAIVSVLPEIKVKKLPTIPLSVLIAGFMQFMFHNISGWVYYAQYYEGNLFWGVLAYNATYVIPTVVVGFVVVMLMKDRMMTIFHALNR